jgi:hypothetical protein
METFLARQAGQDIQEEESEAKEDKNGVEEVVIK